MARASSNDVNGCTFKHSSRRRADRLTRHPQTDFYYETVPTPVIHDRQRRTGGCFGRGIIHKIHTSPLSRSYRCGHRASVKGDVLPLHRSRWRLQRSLAKGGTLVSTCHRFPERRHPVQICLSNPGHSTLTVHKLENFVSSTLRLLPFLPLASSLNASRLFPTARGDLNLLRCCGSIAY